MRQNQCKLASSCIPECRGRCVCVCVCVCVGGCLPGSGCLQQPLFDPILQTSHTKHLLQATLRLLFLEQIFCHVASLLQNFRVSVS